MKLSFSFIAGAILTAPLLGAMPSHAAPACSGGYTIADLIALGTDGCIIGDKIYSNFNFTGPWPGSSNFSFSNSPLDQHTFGGTGLALLPGGYGYGYKVEIAPGNPLQRILGYRTGSGTSDLFNPLVSTKTLTGAPGGTITAINDLTSPPYLYSPLTGGPVVFTSAINVTSGRLDILTDTIGQVEVPGPLPVLGAGVAFGYSRKLRQRIKSTV